MVNIKIKDINKIINNINEKLEDKEIAEQYGFKNPQKNISDYSDKEKIIKYINTYYSRVLATFLNNLTYDIVELEINKEDDSKTGSNVFTDEIEFKLKHGQTITLKINEEIEVYDGDEEEMISKFQIEIGYSPIIRATVPITEDGLIKEYLFDSRDIISISYNRDDEDGGLQLL